MGRAAAIARQIGWYWSTLMGDNHYRRYVAPDTAEYCSEGRDRASITALRAISRLIASG